MREHIDRPGRPPTAAGFTLLEMLVVVAIAGVLSGLAVSTLSELAQGYLAREDARRVHLAVSTARTLAHRRNEPVLVTIRPQGVELSVPDLPPPPHGFLLTIPAWRLDRALPVPRTVQMVAGGGLDVGTSFAFCPSGEYRFLDGSGGIAPGGVGQPVCPVGDMASRSGKLRFRARGQDFHLELRAPLSSVELRTGGG